LIYTNGLGCLFAESVEKFANAVEWDAVLASVHVAWVAVLELALVAELVAAGDAVTVLGGDTAAA